MKRTIMMMSVTLALLLISAVAPAQTTISSRVIANGGARMTGTSNILVGTVGQSAIGVTSGPANVHQIGFWYQPVYTLTPVEDVTPLLPAEPWLGQNHPNPFNPITTISFYVPTKGHVSLRVYDLSGRLVRTLVAQDLEPGNHEASFVGDGLASGVYVYRMIAGDFVQTKKLMLVK